ncbi:MAG: hypothetical protein QXR26_07550 [Candidatus Caldarchaeum sp.]
MTVLDDLLHTQFTHVSQTPWMCLREGCVDGCWRHEDTEQRSEVSEDILSPTVW